MAGVKSRVDLRPRPRVCMNYEYHLALFDPDHNADDSVLRRDAGSVLAPKSREKRQHSTLPTDADEHPQASGSKHPPSEAQNSVRNTFQSAHWRPPPPYEIFRAIENKDLMYLMEVRDHAFHLLLQKTGDATPLVHAMRIGESHRDVAIVLLGAFSRWINHLEDEDFKRPRTRLLLKALRVNLKLAIDYGLQQSQSDLLASFMQTLIMTEGDRWVAISSASIASALGAGAEGKPVGTAESLVRAFATKELGKSATIASLEAYIANASIDLVLLGIWNLVMEKIPVEPIPTYFFARDERVLVAFRDGLRSPTSPLSSLPRQLRWQIQVVLTVMDGRSTNFKSKLQDLARQLDHEIGS